MILRLCAYLQATGFSTMLRESTWGFPIASAVHVLGLAWFGGAALAKRRRLRQIGLVFLLTTGAIVFAIEPLKCYHSAFFWAKLLLIAMAALLPRVAVALWIAVIFASRGIGYF
jgi:hypothetical protein